MAYSTTSILQWAGISQVLAAKDMGRKGAPLGYPDYELDQKISVERASLQWEYDQDPSSDYLYPMGNYVFSLCFPYIFEAMLVSGGSGSSATTTTPGSSYIYNQLNLVVDTSTGLVSGASTYTNTILIGAQDLNFFLLDNTVLSNGTDFSFDNSTGTVTLLSNTWVASSRVVIPFNQLI